MCKADGKTPRHWRPSSKQPSPTLPEEIFYLADLIVQAIRVITPPGKSPTSDSIGGLCGVQKCWARAYWRWHWQPGKTQARTLRQPAGQAQADPSTEYEQRHGAKVNEFRENPVGVNAVAAAPAETAQGGCSMLHVKRIMWLYVPAGLICPAPHVGPIHCRQGISIGTLSEYPKVVVGSPLVLRGNFKKSRRAFMLETSPVISIRWISSHARLLDVTYAGCAAPRGLCMDCGAKGGWYPHGKAAHNRRAAAGRGGQCRGMPASGVVARPSGSPRLSAVPYRAGGSARYIETPHGQGWRRVERVDCAKAVLEGGVRVYHARQSRGQLLLPGPLVLVRVIRPAVIPTPFGIAEVMPAKKGIRGINRVHVLRPQILARVEMVCGYHKENENRDGHVQEFSSLLRISSRIFIADPLIKL